MAVSVDTGRSVEVQSGGAAGTVTCARQALRRGNAVQPLKSRPAMPLFHLRAPGSRHGRRGQGAGLPPGASGRRRCSSVGRSCSGSARRGDLELSLIGEHPPSQFGRSLKPFDHPLRWPMASYPRDRSRVPCPPLCLSAWPHSVGSAPRWRLRSAQAQTRCAFVSQLPASLRP